MARMQCAILETVWWALSFSPGWSDNSFGRGDVIHKEHLYSLGEDGTSFYCQIILVWLKNQRENFLFNARKEYYMRCLKSWPWGQLLGLMQSVFIPELLSETEELGRVILMISGIAVPLSINCISHVRLSLCCSVALSCPTLCGPMACIVHGILRARMLEWVAVPFSKESSKPSDRTQVSHIAGKFLTIWATREAKNNERDSCSKCISEHFYITFTKYKL